jgi:S1-C subfamily serine protease
MLRAVLLATLALAVIPLSPSGQASSVLHIKVVLLDPGGLATPVPRHRLLVTDNPASSTPRLITTRLDGTADVTLRPGNYTVESDQPVVFHGKAYQWIQTLDVAAGRDTTLELTASNAEVEPATSTTTAAGPALENDPSFLLPRWQESVVGLWTPTTHASGFILEVNGTASGLIVTNQRVIGTATSVEVQLTSSVKVGAMVVASDAARDVAILRVDPKTIASVRPIPLSCAQSEQTAVASGQEIFTIGVPMRQSKGMTSGTVSRIHAQELETDLTLARGSSGGPVFTARGDLVGITSIVNDSDQNRGGDPRVIRSETACEVVAAAEKKLTSSAAPAGTLLPVEPLKPFPPDALRKMAEGRAGSLTPYQMSSSDFDVAFITPVLIYGAQYQAEQFRRRRTTSKDTRKPEPEPQLVRPLMDFANWSDYVVDFPPVLLVRVTPRLVEGFWTTVGRVAAQTQGVSIPAIKRFKSGFGRMRAFCGDKEVTPIHPFRLEQRVSESDAIYEGLYVFDPGALTPECGTVKLVLYSEKEPDKGDTRVIDPKVIQQVWQDFEPYRASVP